MRRLWLSLTVRVCVEPVVFTNKIEFTHVAVAVTAVAVVGNATIPLS